MNSMIHIFNRGERVLFRDDNDYIYFLNRFAVMSKRYKMNPLAIAVMSTHFHAVIEPFDSNAVDPFFSSVKKSYCMYYHSKYRFSISRMLKLSSVNINDSNMAAAEIVYVLRNPMHHYVTQTAMEYRFSNASSIFAEKLLSCDYMSAHKDSLNDFGDLTKMEKRRIYGLNHKSSFGSNHELDAWNSTSGGMITFRSFINETRVRSFWNNNPKSFLYDMNKNIKDAKGEEISSDSLDLRGCSLSDIDVCKIIDNQVKFTGLQSFHHLNVDQKAFIANLLAIKNVPTVQIRRCLWV